MTRPALLLGLVAGLLVTLSTVAGAAPVDPRLRRALETGLVVPAGAHLLPRGERQVAAVVELKAPVGPAALRRLAATGAQVRRTQGRPLAYQRFTVVRLGRRALDRIAALPEVRKVWHVPSRGPLPLDHSAAIIGLAHAWGARPAHDLLTGAGVTVADLDTNVDVFHPAFFRGDGGYFDWIDVNGDGVLSLGVDALDLDGDGLASPGETARLLRAETLYTFTGAPADARSAAFDPGIDWLYLDENGNGTRDFGPAGGFDDSTPAFGEPLFVPDDLNRSGTLDVGERVIRLRTSKLRKVFAHLQYYGDLDHVFERGVDLSSLEVNYTNGLYGYSDALHATGVLAIVAGDLPLAGRRWVGMAPDAELLLGWEEEVPVAGTIWALEEGAQVMLYELSPWTGLPLDGSDPLSQLIDDSTLSDEVIHTCPVGNQAAAGKHAFVTVPEGGTADLTFDVPGGWGFTYIDVSLNAQGPEATTLTATLEEPDGTVHTLGSSPGTLSTGASYYPIRDTTSRGTRFIDVILYTTSPSGSPVPTGDWVVHLTAAPDTTVDAFVSDELSGFGPGVAWDNPTDASTIGAPSVADHCIAVAAHTGHPATPGEPWFPAYPPGGPGEVRDYSAWGPRLDGLQKPDLAAPDNPWVAAPHDRTWGYGNTTVPHGALWPFGGTSGAGPHVTGIAALLWQAEVRGVDAADALREGVLTDGLAGPLPDFRYGYGRLSAAGALGATADGSPPSLTITQTAGDEGTTILTPTATDPDGDELELRWDDDYDGTWDTAYGPVAPRQVTPSPTAPRSFKARVRDSAGLIGEAVVVVTRAAVDADGGVNGDGGVSADDGDGCGCRAVGRASRDAQPVGASGLSVVLLVGVAASLRCRRRRRVHPERSRSR